MCVVGKGHGIFSLPLPRKVKKVMGIKVKMNSLWRAGGKDYFFGNLNRINIFLERM
jgi:hypothetical protein